MKKILILLAACLFVFAACSHGNNPGGDKGAGTYIGTKTPEEAKAVGDIVFNDGSAIPYTDELTLTDAQKQAAIAIIFYKGTGLNSGDDTTTSRTLGVGLKQDKQNLVWCKSSAQAHNKLIEAIVCYYDSDTGVPTFTGDKNGSDNLEQIEGVDGIDDTTGAGANERYPAFYFGKNYKETESRIISGSEFETGWFLPTIAELFQINACIKDSENGFDLNAASKLCGGDEFVEGIIYYWSSNQWHNVQAKDCACGFLFQNKYWFCPDHKSCNDGESQKGFTCAIREF